MTRLTAIQGLLQQLHRCMLDDQDANQGGHSEVFYDLAEADYWLRQAVTRLVKREADPHTP